MNNFFTDNEDLKFIFETSDLDCIIRAMEDNFSQAGIYDYAPDDKEDAIDSYRHVLEVGGDVAASIIAPLSECMDKDPNILKDGKVEYSAALSTCLKALFQADLMGCSISRKYGGLNLPCLIFTMLVEIISRADAGIQNIFGLQGVAEIIEMFADDVLKEKYLPLLAEGEVTCAMALTEDEAGSDLQNIKLKAFVDADGTWHLSGVKRFITNGCADVLLVLARSEAGTTDGLGLSLFLCEGDSSVKVRRLEDKLGIHSSPTCEVSFNNTRAYLIGEQQRGLVTYVLALLNGARLATAAQSTGIAQAAFSEARKYAAVRKQYGRTIETFSPVAEMLSRMKIKIEASRALACETAGVMDLAAVTTKKMSLPDIDPGEKRSLRKESKRLERLTMLLTSLAKYYCSEACIQVTRDALQVMGGNGYMRDYPVEKYYRDARITNIYEGTSQMQIISAFRGILSGVMEKYYDELVVEDMPAAQVSLQKKLLRARQTMSKSVSMLGSQKDNRVVELYSRHVVDMAVEILSGYLFIRQSVFSKRKLKIARMYIKDLGPRFTMRVAFIKRGDKSCLKDYSEIVGPAVSG